MPKMNFPSRADRQKILEELRRLEREQGKAFTGSELYQAYKEAFLALDRRMEPLYELNDRGVPPELTAQDKEELTNLMLRAGQAGEQYLAAWLAAHREQGLNEGLPGMVQQLQRLMNRDYDALSLYDPAKPQTLPEIQENARTKTIDLRGRNMKKLGNMQNARMLMTLHGTNGKTRTGVFTKASYVRVKAQFDELLARAKAQCGPEGAAELDKVVSKIRQDYIQNLEKTRGGRNFKESDPDDLIVGTFLNRLRLQKRDADAKISSGDVRYLLGLSGVNLDLISSKAIKTLTGGFDEMIANPGNEINAYGLQLRDGERLDNRNAAMSAVADLLGIGSAVARADNMRFLNDDGTVVEGSFMDFGKGLDLDAHPEDAIFVNDNPMGDPETRGRLYRSIADLQVLDSLCLNVDRHEGNLMYRVDKQGNLIGVQGIDNDSSFGSRRHLKSDICKLKVVSQSMANKLRDLTPEMLRFTLRGRGLSEEEIQCAGARLNDLKTGIEKKWIRTVPDEKFRDLVAADVCSNEGRGNLFDSVLREMKWIREYRQDHRLGFRPLENENPPELAKVPTTERKYTAAGMADAADRVGRLLLNDETGFRVKNLTGLRGSSQSFKDMVAAAQAVSNLPLHLQRQGKLDPTVLLRDERAKATEAEFDEAFDALRAAASLYLGGKMEQRGADSLESLRGKNSYEQARIDYAKELLAASNSYNKLREGPQTEAEKAEEQSLADRRAMEERRAARKQEPEAADLLIKG